VLIELDSFLNRLKPWLLNGSDIDHNDGRFHILDFVKCPTVECRIEIIELGSHLDEIGPLQELSGVVSKLLVRTDNDGRQHLTSLQNSADLLDRNFLRLATLRQYTMNGGALMDGLYNFTVQEPIFREHLQELDDEELSRAARNHLFLCETSIGGPWRIDLFKTNLIKEEFARRGKSELFEVAEGFIRKSLGH
jgi:hypothetical protein